MTRTRTLLAAAALAALAPAAASADAHMTSPFPDVTLEYGKDYLATTLIGERIHITEDEFEPGSALAAGASDEWDDIGEIGDMIIGVDGTLDAIVIDVGGFLGIGEKEVAVSWSALQPVYEEDQPDDWIIALRATRDEIEAAPELRRVPAE